MKSLVVYDSNLGNTKLIAMTIAKALDTKAVSIDEEFDLKNIDILFVGSPIIGWMPTVKMQKFLNNLKNESLKGIKVVTFDTRIKLFIHGDAMLNMARILEQKGAIYIDSMPFYVKGKYGSLIEGEVQKAEAWANTFKVNN